MFLKFILFNQNMIQMNHHPSLVVQNKMKLCNAQSEILTRIIKDEGKNRIKTHIQTI